MAARDRLHISVNATTLREPYTSRGGGSGESPAFSGSRSSHGQALKNQLDQAQAAHEANATGAIELDGAVDGIFLEFESFPDLELALASLEPQQGNSPPELRAVSDRIVNGQTVQVATVFVPEPWVTKFADRFEQYINEDTPGGNPRHANLVQRIAHLRLATLKGLWTDRQEDFPAADENFWWEVWLRRRDGTDERLKRLAERLGLTVGSHRLVFEDRLVALVEGTADQLGAALVSLDDLAELRKPAAITQLLAAATATDQAEWVDDLANRVRPAESAAPVVCILDSGVSSGHPLLAGSLATEDCLATNSSWDLSDRRNHGTRMAGLALFGDLGAGLVSTATHRLNHRLESVKILPDASENEPELYGSITAQAVSAIEIVGPGRARTFALAVTAETAPDEDRRRLGEPTAWSATLDALAAGRAAEVIDEELVYLDGHAEAAKRLFVVSAGNVRALERDHLSRSDIEPVEDPAQSWNALTVGAWTDRSDLSGEVEPFPTWSPLAPPGELSPWSRTSVAFRPIWPHKPEVVFEGGNAALPPNDGAPDTPPGLQVLTTRRPDASGRLLDTISGTSAATAQAANMAAEIAADYPAFWPETVRALIVNSARWTDRMTRTIDGASGRAARVAALRRYGWGVPDLARALRSADDAVTLIAQDTIRPYESGKFREMNVHDLPWPIDELEALGDTPVEMRIALSYFVEPNPGRRGWAQRFRYASHGLRVEARRPTEDTDDFRKRLNKLAAAEGERITSSGSDSAEWFLGSRQRVRGSLHADIWRGSAAELAARGCLAVVPVTGWWKEQPRRDRSDESVRYSLVVSIEAPEVEVDIWTPTAIAAQVPIVVTTEVEI